MAYPNTATIPTATPIVQSLPGRTLFYPIDIGADPTKNPDGIDINRPIIMFRCEGRVGIEGAQYIGFPIPQGIDFSDGASYDNATLGYTGAAAAGAASFITSGNAVDQAKTLAGQGGIDMLKSKFSNIDQNTVAFASAASVLGQDVKSAVGVGMKMTMNQHIVTEFTGVGTRSFGFKFKLVASTKKESDVIRNIGTAFRNGLYPEANVLALKYPPKWTIRFLWRNTDIEYLPKIWECYLENLNVSYNGSANLWHTDGSPIECDITVTFKETRALYHQDIRNLDDRPFFGIPEANRNGYTIPQTEPLFSNSGTTDITNPNATPPQ